MKKKGKQYVVLALFMSLLVLVGGKPQVALGAEGGGMDNQVGIQFENDYTPSSSTTEPTEPPTPMTPSVEQPPTAKPVGRTSLPSTGELLTGGVSLLGFILAGLGISLLYARKKRDTRK